MALIFRSSGANVENIDVLTLTMEKIHQLVEGYFEKVKCQKGVLYVNDEAALTGLPFNSDASQLAGQTIRGNAIFLTTLEEQELNNAEI